MRIRSKPPSPPPWNNAGKSLRFRLVWRFRFFIELRVFRGSLREITARILPSASTQERTLVDQDGAAEISCDGLFSLTRENEDERNFPNIPHVTSASCRLSKRDDVCSGGWHLRYCLEAGASHVVAMGSTTSHLHLAV